MEIWSFKHSLILNVMLQATHLGLQRKVLAELGKPQSLVQPSELYQFCLVSGETALLQCGVCEMTF